MLINGADVMIEGEYGCLAENGIEPSIWANFAIDILGINFVGLPYLIIK